MKDEMVEIYNPSNWIDKATPSQPVNLSGMMPNIYKWYKNTWIIGTTTREEKNFKNENHLNKSFEAKKLSN